MPASHQSGPRPACVEDFDDDKNTTISDTRAFARVGKDGSDSGYSSRTGTLDGEHLDSGRVAEMKSRAVQIERERQPYSGGQAVRRRESINQQRPSRPMAPEQNRPAKDEKKKFCHPPGICWTCDRMGYHLTQEELNDIKKSHSGGKPSAPESPKAVRKPSNSKVQDQGTDTKLRRMSSHRESRPLMQYPPSATPPISAVYAVPAAYYASGYATPGTPTGYAPTPPSYPYAYPPTSTAQVPASYIAQPTRQEYFDQSVPDIRPPRSSRRPSLSEEQDIPRPRDEHIEPQPSRREDVRPAERIASRKESRPQMTKHQSTRSVDFDKHDHDRQRMPPPELPVKRSEQTHRSSVKKKYTYDDEGQGRQRPPDMSDEVATQVLEKRRSRDAREHGHTEIHGSVPVRTRDLSPLKQSTSHRAPTEQLSTRQPARKSVSYSDPYYVQTVAKSSVPHETTQRRATTPATKMDAKVAEAEAYQNKRGSMTSDELSAEKLKSLKSSKVSPRSDAGSNYSHRESHYSKDSTARTAQRNSIVIETSSKSRPLSIQMPGGLTVQIGPDQEQEKEKTKRKEQKLLEHGQTSASAASQSSAPRSRAATSTYSSSERGRDRDSLEKVSKRSSHVIDTRPPPSPVKTSSKSSRATSRSRATSDADAGRPRR